MEFVCCVQVHDSYQITEAGQYRTKQGLPGTSLVEKLQTALPQFYHPNFSFTDLLLTSSFPYKQANSI